jgi:hypothetical protein
MFICIKKIYIHSSLQKKIITIIKKKRQPRIRRGGVELV